MLIHTLFYQVYCIYKPISNSGSFNLKFAMLVNLSPIYGYFFVE